MSEKLVESEYQIDKSVRSSWRQKSVVLHVYYLLLPATKRGANPTLPQRDRNAPLFLPSHPRLLEAAPFLPQGVATCTGIQQGGLQISLDASLRMVEGTAVLCENEGEGCKATSSALCLLLLRGVAMRRRRWGRNRLANASRMEITTTTTTTTTMQYPRQSGYAWLRDGSFYNDAAYTSKEWLLSNGDIAGNDPMICSKWSLRGFRVTWPGIAPGATDLSAQRSTRCQMSIFNSGDFPSRNCRGA